MCSGSRSRTLLPGRLESVGRTAADNRVFVNGVRQWCFGPERDGATFRKRYGKYKAYINASFGGLIAASGRRCFTRSCATARNQYLMIDSTIVRAHQQAATADVYKLKQCSPKIEPGRRPVSGPEGCSGSLSC